MFVNGYLYEEMSDKGERMLRDRYRLSCSCLLRVIAKMGAFERQIMFISLLLMPRVPMELMPHSMVKS